MEQKDKDLLLKDLCARLPYGVKCYIQETNDTSILAAVLEDGENTLFNFWEDSRKIQYWYQLYISEFKPYLFPMSSMTDEQKEEFNQLLELELKAINDEITHTQATEFEIDFYNKHHLDWRGLISKGLAIDATDLNIY